MVEARDPFVDGADIESDLEVAQAHSRGISMEAREAELRAKELREVSSIIKALPMSWAQRDPGKYGPCYRLLAGSVHVVVEELLPDDVEVFRGTREEWEEHPLNTKSHHGMWKIVPPHQPKVENLEQVMHQACPSCDNSRPVIEEYYQTYDSPYGDEWRKRKLVLCCDKVQILDEKFAGGRF